MPWRAELKTTLVPERSYHGLMARTTVHGQNVWLLEPQTFMNLSRQVRGLAGALFKILPEEILVVRRTGHCPGQVKLKRGGSHAGHNGLRDIHGQLGSPRLLLAPAHRHRPSGRPRAKWPTGCSRNRRQTSAR